MFHLRLHRHPPHVWLLGVLAGFSSPQAQTESFRSKLELFFALDRADSAQTLHCGTSGSMELVVRKQGTGEARTLAAKANPQAAARLCEEAAQAGLITGTLVAGEAEDGNGPRSSVDDAGRASDLEASVDGAPAEVSGDEAPSRSRSAQKQNRLSYVATQSVYGFLTYGPALIHAFDLDGRVAGAVSLFSLTGAIAGHTYYALPRNFEDAHMVGLNYGAISSGAISYLLPLLALGDNGDPARVGSTLLLGAYPLGIWSGYWFGDRLVNDPGRAALAPTFAYTGALLMALASPIYLPESAGFDVAGRVFCGTLLAAGVGGHAASAYYRQGETIPTGVPLGIVAHTLLGLGLGATVLSNLDSQDPSVRGIFSILTAGTAAGLAEGLWFFRDSRDDYDRSFFSFLGLGGGMALAGGVLTLSDPTDEGVWALGLYAGALAGYAGTYALLKPQPVRQGQAPSERIIQSVEVNPVPLPEPVRLADGTVDRRWRVPGLTVRF